MRAMKLLPVSIALTLLTAASYPQDRETVAKPLSAKDKKKREDNLRNELKPYRNWVETDVAYIITDEERQAFNGLNNDEERDQFIEQFWRRRDPTPDTEENEFREEHYRRIAYANERYASGMPGWKTDRGKIYIKFGPPDEIEPHPSGGPYQRPPEEGGGQISTYPFEIWRYRHIDGVGSNIMIEFVDPTVSGEYRRTIDPQDKNALQHVPSANPAPLNSRPAQPESQNQFTRLELNANLDKPPAGKFPDLETAIHSRITYNLLPMAVRTDFIRVTDSSVMANITLQFENKDLQFAGSDNMQRAAVNILGTITTLSRRPVNRFERTVTVETAPQFLHEQAGRSSIYQESIPLFPGLYRLNIAAKDIASGNLTNYEAVLNVPRFEEDRPSASSLILADQIERAATKSLGAGQFVIGSWRVRPRVTNSFRQNEKLGVYMQLYHFAGNVEYEIVDKRSSARVFSTSEDAGPAIEKFLPLAEFVPGEYILKVKGMDRKTDQTLTASAQFTVVK